MDPLATQWVRGYDLLLMPFQITDWNQFNMKESFILEASHQHLLWLNRTGHMSFLTRQDWTPKFAGQVLPDTDRSCRTGPARQVLPDRSCQTGPAGPD